MGINVRPKSRMLDVNVINKLLTKEVKKEIPLSKKNKKNWKYIV